MIGTYAHADTMMYYLTFIQRGINDSFAAVKKVSMDLKRLYVAGQDREAEKKLLTELSSAVDMPTLESATVLVTSSDCRTKSVHFHWCRFRTSGFAFSTASGCLAKS